MGELDARKAVVAAGARLGARGLIAGAEGNLSVRLDEDRLLVTPAGLRKDELRPEDLLVVPLVPPAGGDRPSAAGLRPSSDMAIHRALLHARPDAGAVVHAHVAASMALTMAGERPEPGALPETALLLPELPLVPFAPMGSAELAVAIVTVLATEGTGSLPNVALLERHGAVAIGSAHLGPAGALREAVDRLELVGVLCAAWRDALLIRAARATLEPK
jgi:L-fuculose-phosphate aldolase